MIGTLTSVASWRIFHTKNPNLDWIARVSFMAIWNILRPFGIYYGPLEYITAVWNILWPFGIYYGQLEYIMAIWNILRPFRICYGHLEYIMAIWNILRYILENCIKKYLATLTN
jgi:hypothetical protein